MRGSGLVHLLSRAASRTSTRGYAGASATRLRATVTALGADPTRAELSIRSEPLPSLPSGAVLVEVQAAAVHWVDCLMLAGQYQHAPPLPYTPGMEYSGVVTAVAPDVSTTSCAVGDRISVDIFNAGPRSYGAYQQEGGFATHAIAPCKGLRRIPDAMSFEEAASFSGAYETAHHALVHCVSGLKPATRMVLCPASLSTLAPLSVTRRCPS